MSETNYILLVVEPGDDGVTPVKIAFTTEAATRMAKAAASARGYEYDTDKEAEEDFIVVHWAEKVELVS